MENFRNQETSNGSKTSFNVYLSKVFMTVFACLLLTLISATLMNMTGNALFYIMHPYAIIIIQLGLSWCLSPFITKLSPMACWGCLIAYSCLMGVSLSALPLLYEGISILFEIIDSLILFAIMAIAGHFTNCDLTKFSFYLFAGVLAIVVVTLINLLFIHSNTLDMLMAYIGLVLFAGITAFDVQRLRLLYIESMNDQEMSEKLLVAGSFQLYLDFVNIFIRILQIFGRQRDDN